MNAQANPSQEAKRQPPGPKGNRLRHLWQRLTDNVGLFERLQKEYGDIVFVEFPFLNACIIYDPGLMQQVFVEKRHCFHQGPSYKRISFLNGPTVITTDEDEHRRRRKLIQPSFRKQALDGYADIMLQEAETLQQNWQDGQTIDLAQTTTQLTLNVAAAAFFGKDTQVDPELVKKVFDAITWQFILSLFPCYKWTARLPLPQNRHARQAFQEMDQKIYAVIKQARDASQERNDLISNLVRAKDEEGVERSLNDDEVRDEAYLILVAGHETTANTLGWTFYLLDRNPEVRGRMEQEIEDVIGDRPPVLEDYAKLPYTRAVIDEALRLYPPIIMSDGRP